MKTNMLPPLIMSMFIVLNFNALGQVSITNDGSAPDNSSMFDIKSTNKGILIPRMTMAERNAITSPAIGLMIYQTDNNPGFYYNTGLVTPDWKIVGNNAGTFSQWTTSGSNIYYNTGNVGIGLASPAAKLHVQGPVFEAMLSGSNYGVYGLHSISGSYGHLGASNEGGFGFSPNGWGLRGTTNNGYGVYGQHSSSGNTGWIGAAGEGVYGSSTTGAGIKGSTESGYAIQGTTTGGGYAGHFTGKTYFNGNLGINETDPSRALYVSQLVTGLSYPLKIENKHTVLNEAAVGILFSAGGSGTNERGKGAIAYQYTNTWNRGAFLFLQNHEANANNPTLSNAVMSITNEGNVGIGIINPASRLEVASNSGPNLIINDLNGSNDRPGIQFKNNTTHFISADDQSEELFGIYSTFNSARTYDAKLAIYGKAGNSWGIFLGLKHDGTDGIIDTDVGDIRMLPADDVIVEADLFVNADLAVNNDLSVATNLTVFGNAFLSGSITTSTKTSYLTTPPAAFTMGSNDDFYYKSYNNGNEIHTSSPLMGYAEYYAPVNLPHGAIVQSLLAYFYDNNSSESLTIQFIRVNLATGDITTVSSPYVNSDSDSRSSVSATFTHTINNQNYMYYFKIVLHDNQTFYGVRLTYTYTTILQ